MSNNMPVVTKDRNVIVYSGDNFLAADSITEWESKLSNSGLKFQLADSEMNEKLRREG